MNEVLSYLKDSCGHESHIKIRKGEIFFSMDCYCIAIKLKDIQAFLLEMPESSLVNIENLSIIDISKSRIESIDIKYGAYLYIENGKEKIQSLSPYTFIFNKLIAVISANFPDFVKDTIVGPYCIDDSCSMCDDVWEYGFTISINKLYWERLDFFLYLDRVMKELSSIKIPSFYLQGESLFDDYEISILPSNTKARRLGYLVLILRMLDNHHRIPVISFNRFFEQYVQSFTQYLTSDNKKGVVVETKTGNSAKPYVELAESLGLIHKTAIYYELGKMGKVYLSLKHAVDIETANPFHLSALDKAFFLEQVLKKDYLYMFILMELICKEEEGSFSILKQVYQKQLLKRISILLNQSINVDSSKLLKLKVLERRIKSWDKPLTYLEHILMPRINWLYDLGLIEYKSNNFFSFTHIGLSCFLNISIWNDLKLGEILNPINYINTYYVKIINYLCNDNAKPYSSENEGILIEYLNQCFNTFGTIAPNRTTFSLAANYCKYMLLWKNHVMLDIDEIKNLLQNQLKKYYIYKFQAQYKDGYIQKR